MSMNSTILSFGGYNPFGMDTSLKQPQLDSPLVVRSGHLSYWVALACALILVYVLRSSNNRNVVDAPFYKAGRIKWMTDAENLVKDSYNKVSKPGPQDLARNTTYVSGIPLTPIIVLQSSVQDQGNRRRPGPNPPEISGRAEEPA
jgi:hypothetical protein